MSPLCNPVGYPSLRKHLFIKFLHFNTLQNHNYIINRTMPTISPRFLHEYRAAWVILAVSESSLDCSRRPWGNRIVVALSTSFLSPAPRRLARRVVPRTLMVPFSPLCLQLRHRPTLRLFVLSCRPWGICVILGVFRSSLWVVALSLGHSGHPWDVHLGPGPFASSLGRSRRPWSVRVVLGLFASSLGVRFVFVVFALFLGVSIVLQPFASSLSYSWRPWAVRVVLRVLASSLGCWHRP